MIKKSKKIEKKLILNFFKNNSTSMVTYIKWYFRNLSGGAFYHDKNIKMTIFPFYREFYIPDCVIISKKKDLIFILDFPKLKKINKLRKITPINFILNYKNGVIFEKIEREYFENI